MQKSDQTGSSGHFWGGGTELAKVSIDTRQLDYPVEREKSLDFDWYLPKIHIEVASLDVKTNSRLNTSGM